MTSIFTPDSSNLHVHIATSCILLNWPHVLLEPGPFDDSQLRWTIFKKISLPLLALITTISGTLCPDGVFKDRLMVSQEETWSTAPDANSKPSAPPPRAARVHCHPLTPFNLAVGDDRPEAKLHGSLATRDPASWCEMRSKIVSSLVHRFGLSHGLRSGDWWCVQADVINHI